MNAVDYATIDDCHTKPSNWRNGDEVPNLDHQNVADDDPDMVNEPPHYGSLDPNHPDLECIDAQLAMVGPDGFECHLKCQVMKYVWRSGRKTDDVDKAIEDLKKARFYINDMIAMYEEKR